MESESRCEKRKFSCLEEKDNDVEFSFTNDSDELHPQDGRETKLLKCSTDISEGHISFDFTAQNKIQEYHPNLQYYFDYRNVADQDYSIPLIEIFSEFQRNCHNFNFYPFQKRCILMIAKKPYRYLCVQKKETDRPVPVHEVFPRKGPDATLVDLPVGTGKTLIACFGALTYVLLNEKLLQKPIKYRMQVSSDFSFYDHLDQEFTFRNIIAICVPKQLVLNWEEAIDMIINNVGDFVKNKYGYELKKYSVANPSKLSPTIGAGNELAFLVYHCSSHGIKSFINIKDSDDNIKYVSYPVSIADECHLPESDYNSNLNNVHSRRFRNREAFTPKFLRAAHYIGVSATLQFQDRLQNYHYNNVNSYLLRRNPLTEQFHHSETNQIDLFHRYYASVTNHQLVNEIKELYKRIKIFKVTLPILQTTYGHNQLQSPDIVFLNLRKTLLEVGIEIPDSFKKNFRLTEIKRLCEETIQKLETEGENENLRITRSHSEMTSLQRKIKKIRDLYERLNISGQKKDCPICMESMKMDESVIVILTCCLHHFHNSCLLKHFKNNNTCPMCRHKDATTIVNKKAKVDEISTCSSMIEQEKKDDNVLLGSSMKCLQEFLEKNPFVHEIEAQGYVVQSLSSRIEQVIRSILFYHECYPEKNLNFLLVNDSCDLEFFTEKIASLVPEDKKNSITLIQHSIHGTREFPMTQNRVKETIKKFKNSTGITFFTCTDDKNRRNDSMVGLDFGNLNGIICLGKVSNDLYQQRIGRLTRVSRFTNPLIDKNCLYIQIE